jgi:hypothetical protein
MDLDLTLEGATLVAGADLNDPSRAGELQSGEDGARGPNLQALIDTGRGDAPLVQRCSQ